MSLLQALGTGRARGMCACMIIASILGLTAPAFAKHPAAKPSELWNQYPLNVQPGSSPSSAAAQSQPSPKASQQSRSTGPSHQVRDVRPRAASNGNGMFFVIAGVAMLLLGIAFSVMKRTSKLATAATGPIGLRPTAYLSTPQEIDLGMDTPSSLEEGQAAETRPASEPGLGVESDLVGVKVKPQHDVGIASSVQQPEERAEASRLVAESNRGAVKVKLEHDVATPPGVQQPEPKVEASPTSLTKVSAPLRPDRERVRIELVDGRSLEGWRTPGKNDQQLVILDVIAAYDAEGNEAPTSRADGFILRTEIASIRRDES